MVRFKGSNFVADFAGSDYDDLSFDEVDTSLADVDYDIPDADDFEDYQVDYTPEIAQFGPPDDTMDLTSSSRTQNFASKAELEILTQLKRGNYKDVLAMVGVAPPSPYLDEGYLTSFRKDYILAMDQNPALKWYPHIANTLSKDEFYVSEDNRLVCSTPDKIANIVDDFDNSNYDGYSPIVDMLSSLQMERNESLKEMEMRKFEDGIKFRDNGDRSELTDILDRNTETVNEHDPFEGVIDSDLRLEDDHVIDVPRILVPEEPDPEPEFEEEEPDAETDVVSSEEGDKIPISLRDLSLSTVIDFLYAARRSVTEDEMEEALTNDGFDEKSIDEILAVIRIKKHKEELSDINWDYS